uniref:Uncharacterized protein n=1 Tax=Ixodes ricinus TaxID=34613 RepID=A0A147BE22_IXORI
MRAPWCLGGFGGAWPRSSCTPPWGTPTAASSWPLRRGQTRSPAGRRGAPWLGPGAWPSAGTATSARGPRTSVSSRPGWVTPGRLTASAARTSNAAGAPRGRASGAVWAGSCTNWATCWTWCTQTWASWAGASATWLCSAPPRRTPRIPQGSRGDRFTFRRRRPVCPRSGTLGRWAGRFG